MVYLAALAARPARQSERSVVDTIFEIWVVVAVAFTVANFAAAERQRRYASRSRSLSERLARTGGYRR